MGAGEAISAKITWNGSPAPIKVMQSCNDDTTSPRQWATTHGVVANGTDRDKATSFEYRGDNCSTTTVVEYPNDPVVFDYKWNPKLDLTRPGRYNLEITPGNDHVESRCQDCPVLDGGPKNCALTVLETGSPITVPVDVIARPCDVEPLPSILPTTGNTRFRFVKRAACKDMDSETTASIEYRGYYSFSRCHVILPILSQTTPPCGGENAAEQVQPVIIEKHVTVLDGVPEWLVTESGFSFDPSQTTTTQSTHSFPKDAGRITTVQAYEVKTEVEWTYNVRIGTCPNDPDPNSPPVETVRNRRTTLYSGPIWVSVKYSDTRNPNPCGLPESYLGCKR